MVADWQSDVADWQIYLTELLNCFGLLLAFYRTRPEALCQSASGPRQAGARQRPLASFDVVHNPGDRLAALLQVPPIHMPDVHEAM